MNGVLTKGNENFNHRFHKLTQIFLFSAFSAPLRFVIFVGVPHGPGTHQACPELVEGMDENAGNLWELETLNSKLKTYFLRSVNHGL